jgi:hypothetical protein
MGAYFYSAWEYVHPAVGWQWTFGSDSDTPAFRPRVIILYVCLVFLLNETFLNKSHLP